MSNINFTSSDEVVKLMLLVVFTQKDANNKINYFGVPSLQSSLNLVAGPSSFIPKEIPRLFLRIQSSRNMKHSIDLHLEPKLKMNGA
jgi:hypothetical protein